MISDHGRSRTVIDLGPAVRQVFGPDAVVASRAPSRYATSHPLDDVVVAHPDGSTTALVLKEVGRFLPGAELAKPAFVRDPGREAALYTGPLARAGIGSARCVGTGQGWLLLEKVPGIELYQVGEPETWAAVAAWLVGAHDALAAECGDGEPWVARLVRHDAEHLGLWARRAETALADSASAAWASALRRAYDAVVEHLLDLPRTVVHGELYPSNVLVCGAGPVERVCPVDWEMAACAPGVLDLAALVAGDWTLDERALIADGYLRATAFCERDLDVASLHLAVQWLGWSPRWRPPREHAHDWLGEAQRLAALLDLV